jgi:23S rRNA G2445 N2-methylase RlmL
MKKTPSGGHKETTYDCEAEVTEGLEFVTEAELRAHHTQILYTRHGEIGFRFSGDLHALLGLRTVQSVSLVKHFDIPRPRALLSNVHLPVLMAQIETVLGLSPVGAFESIYIAAAGAESSVMQRIKQTVAEHTDLAIGDDKGDLWVRIRPGRGGWETVVRLSPRPLVTRAWRVCNLEGALNAATAQAMVILSQPKADDIFVNLGCGSGTLVIERISHSRCKAAIGFDNQTDHLRCALSNLQASGQSERVHLQRADITRLPLEGGSVSALCADLPFGQLTGTHQENERLYPLALQEAARIAKPGARFVLITHEVRLMDRLLSHPTNWSLEQLIRINLRGLHPRIYILQRR